MRTVSILLLSLAAIATVNALATAFYPPYKNHLREIRAKAFPEISRSATASGAAAPGLSASDAELALSIERMTAGIDALVASVPNASGAVAVTVSGSSVPLTAASGSVSKPVEPPAPPAEPEYPLPGILLARLMPDVFPKKIENKGIFDIHIFRGIGYSTYADEKTKTKFYAFSESYGVMLSNLKLVSAVYEIRETDTFFDAAFFLNATNKRDTNVRFVTELEGKAIGVEVPKAAYPKLKKLLLQQ